MNALETELASLEGTRLTLGGLFGWLRTQGRLGPLVCEALAAQFVQEQARQAGQSVTDEELQSAADRFRRRQGLRTATDTHTWLAAQGLSLDDFEAGLEQELLAAKLRQHLTGADAEVHFATHPDDYERLRLTQVAVPREDLARELASQVSEEGRDLAEVAREQGLQVDRGDWFRKDLDASLAFACEGEVIGPVGTPKGFVLAVVEERWPPELDAATRQRIQDDLYQGWLAGRMREASINLPLAGASR